MEMTGETSIEIELLQAKRGNDSETKVVQKDEPRCRICLETFPEKNPNSDSNGKTKADGSDSKGDLGEESSDSTGKTKAETPDSPGEVLELGCECKDPGKIHKHCALRWFKDTKRSSQCEVCKGTVQNLDHIIVSSPSLVSPPTRASPPHLVSPPSPVRSSAPPTLPLPSSVTFVNQMCNIEFMEKHWKGITVVGIILSATIFTCLSSKSLRSAIGL